MFYNSEIYGADPLPELHQMISLPAAIRPLFSTIAAHRSRKGSVISLSYWGGPALPRFNPLEAKTSSSSASGKVLLNFVFDELSATMTSAPLGCTSCSCSLGGPCYPNKRRYPILSACYWGRGQIESAVAKNETTRRSSSRAVPHRPANEGCCCSMPPRATFRNTSTPQPRPVPLPSPPPTNTIEH